MGEPGWSRIECENERASRWRVDRWGRRSMGVKSAGRVEDTVEREEEDVTRREEDQEGRAQRWEGG